MQPTIQLDTRGLNAVLQEYQRHNRRDWADICNDKALDVAFRAIPETPKADVSGIKALPSKPWWNKYVAKRIAGKGATYRKGKSKIHIQGKGYDRKDAQNVSKMIIAARSRSVAFLKSGWLPAIRRLLPLSKKPRKSSTQGSKQYGVDKGSATPAHPGDNPAAFIINSAIGIEKHGVAPLQRAIDGSVADMVTYINRKLEESARRVAR